MSNARELMALTLWPEWAYAVCHLGKRVENRPWAPTERQLRPGERFAIHAGKSVGGAPGRAAYQRGIVAVRDMAWRAGWATPMPNGNFVLTEEEAEAMRRLEMCPTSAIVATAVLDRVAQDDSLPWAVPGSFHWCLRDVVVLDRPVPCRGLQKLWRVSRVLSADECARLARGES